MNQEAVKQLLDDAQLLKKLGEEPALNFVDKQTTINNLNQEDDEFAKMLSEWSK